MHPRTGGRAVLELLSADEAVVRYRAALYTSDRAHHGEATITTQDGSVTWSSWTPDEPPSWLVKYAQTFLRSAWRNRKDEDWPRRINRWRDARDPG